MSAVRLRSMTTALTAPPSWPILTGRSTAVSVTAVVVRDLGRVVAGHGRPSGEGITLAWHGSDMDRYTGQLARLP